MAEITINGKICECVEGEYVLNIARRNGIFIPAICYLSGCSPTLACRLCLAEADGKRIYSCNAKAKDGMVVVSDTDELELERRAIMQTYCINHPLECGVCDQSGECELQNFVHHMGVTQQEYAIKDTHKPHQDWGFINYDPSLCIVCERCISVCKDKIGEAALKTVPRGGEALNKGLKDTMPKEAYAVWNKFQKNIIGPSDGDKLSCSMCGECTAVCPVGALVGARFQYSSNAWELNKIPASNPHSSDCELIYYDVKPTSIENRKKRIYRVSSDFDFGELNAAARFGYDFNKDQSYKDREVFEKIVSKIQNGEIKTIKFNSFITNEEAKILSNLKDKFGLNLVNKEAKDYQNFLKEFTKYSGESLYNGDFDSVKDAEFIISAGSFLRSDAPNVSYKLNNALKMNKASGVYFHPLRDKVVEKYSKNFISCNHNVDDEMAILLWILQKFGKSLPSWLAVKLQEGFSDSKKLIQSSKKEMQTQITTKKIVDEDGNEVEINEEVSKEVVVKFEEEIDVRVSNYAAKLALDEDKIDELIQNKSKFSLIIGEDFITSKEAKTLAKLAGMIQRYTEFKLLIIPPRTNSLGVATICELDDESVGEVLGYNEDGDFTFSCLKGADLDAPALNEQEGTFFSLDKRVVPTNAALAYDGYELNDIASALGQGSANTIDMTPNLGILFKNIKFDDLQNHYENSGENCRGYKVEGIKSDPCDEEFALDGCSNSKTDGMLIYKANPIHQFSKFTNVASQLNEAASLYAGEEFLTDNGLTDGDIVTIKSGEKGLVLKIKFDKETSGAYVPFFDDKIDTDGLFETRFGYFVIERNEL